MPEKKGRESAPGRKRSDGREARPVSLLQLSLFDTLDPMLPAPPAAPPLRGTRSPVALSGPRWANLGGRPVAWYLRRAHRRTIGFSIDDDGLRISAPRWVTIAEIERAIASKAAWILRKLDEWRRYLEHRRSASTPWRDGDSVQLLGCALTLRAAPGTLTITRLDDVLQVGVPSMANPGDLREPVQGWLREQAREVFASRLPVYTQRLGREPSRWTLSSARTRWGSCAADGSIRLNWRLIHFPVDVVDYVIAHELAHLIEMNHGPRFWALVGRLFPDFERARECLRAYPPESTGS